MKKDSTKEVRHAAQLRIASLNLSPVNLDEGDEKIPGEAKETQPPAPDENPRNPPLFNEYRIRPKNHDPL